MNFVCDICSDIIMDNYLLLYKQSLPKHSLLTRSVYTDCVYINFHRVPVSRRLCGYYKIPYCTLLTAVLQGPLPEVLNARKR